jgi:hypothetical protein
MKTAPSSLRSICQPLLLLLLCCGFSLEAEGASVRVKMWKNLGTFDWTWADGTVAQSRIHVEVTHGMMDHTGKVTVSHTFIDDRGFIAGGTSKAHAFLAAKPGVWFVEDYWNPLLPGESPPPVGYNIPRGLQVLSSHEHDSDNWRYDVVAPVAAGTLRFQLEPQDVVCQPNGSFELSVWVVSAPVPLTVQWYRILASGVEEAVGIPETLVGSSDSFYGVLGAKEASRTYLVKVSDGSKTITSKVVKVRRTVGGNEDIVGSELPDGGATIRGKVWEEITVNDIDDGEPGLRGIEVVLLLQFYADETLGDLLGRKIAGRATTAADGSYVFYDVPPTTPTTRYRVNWRFSEDYHVARPYIGGNTTVDCDAEFASSLINVPTNGPLTQDSGKLAVVGNETIDHIDLGLFEKPTLTFVESGHVATEESSDVLIEITYELSKPLRYTPLTFHFRTFSFPQGFATRLVDYRQEDVTATTIPAGSTTGVVRFTIIADNSIERPETFHVEQDGLLNSNHIKRVQRPDVYWVGIVDTDVKPVAPGDLFKEYQTAFGNRILTSGYSDFSTGEPLFWEWAPEFSTNGKPSFKAGPANGLIAHAVLTAPNAKGPRTVSFDWKMSGTSEDVMMVFTQDLNVQYDEGNAPTPIAQLSGVTGWQSVSFNVPEGHVINLSIFKGEITDTFIEGWVRNLDLGGPDSPDAVAQPESLALTGLEEMQKPAAKTGRALGVPSQNSSGVYAGVVETGEGSADQAGSLSNLSVSTKGAVSGTAVVGGKSVPVRGTFNGSGKFSTQLTGKDGATATVFLQMQTEVTSGGVEVVGTLADDAGNSGSLTAQKPVKWVAKVNPCPFAGRYSLILPQRANGAPHLPTGEGFASIVIGVTGKVTLSGVLGDGTAFTAASSVTPTGRIPVQKRLYANKGSVSGVLQIRDVANVSDIDGKLRWVKPVNAKSKLHKEGFDTGVTALGCLHNPLLRPPLSGLAGVGPWLIHVELSGGDFIKIPIGLEASLSVKGATATLKEKTPPVGQKAYLLIRGTANLTTGAVSFTYEDKYAKKKVSCRGLIFQKQNRFTGFMSGTAAMGSFVTY